MAEKFLHTTLQCLTAIAQHHGLQVNPERLIHDYALTAEEPSSAMLLGMASSIGLKARLRQLTVDKLLGQKGVFPLLARMKDGNSMIVVGARGDDGGVLAVLDPLGDLGSVKMLEPSAFQALWSGEVLFLKRTSKLTDTRQPFGLRWFIPEILQQKAAFRDIAIAAMAMNVLGLASPIFFQLVIDKVLVHHSVSTLWVLAVGIVIALLFESTFGFMRRMLTLWGTNKIDIRLTRRTFAQLLSLPIDYFETTSAGVVVRHMQQMEKIRNFLTGRMFSTALDLTALFILLPILFSYSIKLAMIVLLFTLMISAIVAILVPTFQRRLNDLYTAEGERQALMVETIHGMRTVKALAIEPMQRRAWDQRSANALTQHFRVGQISIAGNAITDFLGKLLPVVIIVIGAQDVFDQTLSVGALIAFQMLSGRVSSP
ncbi:MAG: peptidase domain-containing ABC transporter, partial [Massilia sp.]|nr:peptidase domain-containing ABC transporter [Massilia sp.]